MALRVLPAALLVLLTCACRTVVKGQDWNSYDGPGARYFHRQEIEFPHVDDPLEPANRVLAGIDLALARYGLAPVAALYRAIVPQGVRTHLRNAGENLLYPTRVVNNLLQGKGHQAYVETARFLVNTTVGLLGLYDPAAKMGLHPYPEDFGQTFARWGWRDSTYLYLPILGSSTLRDALGEIPNAYTDPGSYELAVAIMRRFNFASEGVEADLRAVRTNYDAYEAGRTLYTLKREVDVEDFSWKRDESGPTQSLEAFFLAPQDPRFAARATEQRVRIPATGESLTYSLWLQPEPAPLVYLVPGMGGHRLSDSTLALAEIAFREGSSVVAVSNPTNWEFIVQASSSGLPGYAPRDAHDLHVALSRIDREIAGQHPGCCTSRRLAGISLGALYTLFIAAAEQHPQSEGLLRFDLYLALDPAVSLEHALLQLDSFYNAPLAFAPEERAHKVDEIFGKVLYLSHGELEPEMELPFTKLEAEFLIGLAYRLDLQYMILQSQERHDLGVLRTERSLLNRAPAFREASTYSYMEYMFAFVLPTLARSEPGITFDEAGAQRVFERCDLRSIADELRANERVLLYANENDFLLRPQDIEWLRELLGERAHFFPVGGHLGNLHKKRIQEVIRGALEDPEVGRSPQRP